MSEDQIPKGHGEVVLLVEDNAILREVLVSTVEEIGYQTRTAANGAEALGILQASPNSIAIVLSDLVMPDMGGEALFRALRQQQIMIPVVMLSGYPMEPEFVKDLVNEGLAGYLMKPPQLEALAQILAKALP